MMLAWGNRAFFHAFDSAQRGSMKKRHFKACRFITPPITSFPRVNRQVILKIPALPALSEPPIRDNTEARPRSERLGGGPSQGSIAPADGAGRLRRTAMGHVLAPNQTKLTGIPCKAQKAVH